MQPPGPYPPPAAASTTADGGGGPPMPPSQNGRPGTTGPPGAQGNQPAAYQQQQQPRPPAAMMQPTPNQGAPPSSAYQPTPGYRPPPPPPPPPQLNSNIVPPQAPMPSVPYQNNGAPLQRPVPAAHPQAANMNSNKLGGSNPNLYNNLPQQPPPSANHYRPGSTSNPALPASAGQYPGSSAAPPPNPQMRPNQDMSRGMGGPGNAPSPIPVPGQQQPYYPQQQQQQAPIIRTSTSYDQLTPRPPLPPQAGMPNPASGPQMPAMPGMPQQQPAPKGMLELTASFEDMTTRPAPASRPKRAFYSTTAQNPSVPVAGGPAGYPQQGQQGYLQQQQPQGQPGYPQQQLPQGPQGYPQQQPAGQGYPQPAGAPGQPYPPYGAPQPGQQQPMYPQPPGPGYPPTDPQQHGMAPPQQRRGPRIDTANIPSPIQTQDKDQAACLEGPFYTLSRQMPPLVTSRFVAVDNGNSSPRFLRMTCNSMPVTDEVARQSEIPIGFLLQPLAEISHEEAPIQTADFSANGPVRCKNCEAYINPFFKFIDAGRKFVCNLCSQETPVPDHYASRIDMSGRREDLHLRPELQFGTVEIIPSKEYYSKPAVPAHFLFIIDVSWNSIHSGIVASCIQAMRQSLFGKADGTSSLPAGSKIAIVTFDSVLHFYNLSAKLEQPGMMIVNDIQDVFSPLSEGLFVDPIESKRVIEMAFDMIPKLFVGNRVVEPVFGSVMQAALMSLQAFGGKVLICQSGLPAAGLGALKNREDAKLIGTEKEKTLYEPQEYFWRKLAQDLCAAGITVDSFFFPSPGYMDVATIGLVSSMTGGETQFYRGFKVEVDGNQFIQDFKLSMERPFGYDALLRVRLSNGVRAVSYFGNFYMKNNTDIELAGIDSLKTIGVQLKHDSKLDERGEVSIQAALLYTTSTGHRRIRLHNFTLPTTTTVTNVFRNTDIDTLCAFMMKYAISNTVDMPMKQVRGYFSATCIRILLAYRIQLNSSNPSNEAQLVLPESCKLLPLLSLSLLKQKAFRMDADGSVDMRVSQMRFLLSLSVAESVALLYPRVIPLHRLAPGEGEADSTGWIVVPGRMRASLPFLEPDGAFLLDNGLRMMLYLTNKVDPAFLQKLFGVNSLEAIDPNLNGLPVLENEVSRRVRAICGHIHWERPRYLNFRIVRQGIDQQAEMEFNSLLTEDANNDMDSYADYLCAVHRQIQNLFAKHLKATTKLFFPNIPLILVRSNLPPNQAVFRCSSQLNKVDIASLLRSLYGVSVTDVRTMNYKAPTRTNRQGRRERGGAEFKKAIVTMEEEFHWPPFPTYGREAEAIKMPPPPNSLGKGVKPSFRTKLDKYLSNGY